MNTWEGNVIFHIKLLDITMVHYIVTDDFGLSPMTNITG